MMRAKLFRRWNLFLLVLLVLAPSAAPLLKTDTAAALAKLSGSYAVKTDVTFANNSNVAANDVLTIDGLNYSGKKQSCTQKGTSEVCTYETNPISWSADLQPPVLNICSQILNNQCSFFTPTSGKAQVFTITGTVGSSSNGNTGSDSGNQSSSPECTDSGDPMSWFLCPVFQGVANISDWIFRSIIIPYLVTSPIDVSGGSSNPTYQVWSNFRIYGDIFLVIALLVLVFGEAIGGGLVDAYTVKKALPRVLAAAILVNLSIYIVAFMVDITNIVGKSIGDILIQPFKNAGDWHFSPNGIQGLGILGVGIIGLLLSGFTILSILVSFFKVKEGNVSFDKSFAKIALEAAFFTLIPIFLAILAVFVTLIVRKGLILFLILISPIAFALYCLPGTQSWFKKWWDLLWEALIVYPIIIIIFAMADILSVTLLNANKVTPNNIDNLATSSGAVIIAIIVAFLLQFLPLLAIPFAFRMAGGTLSKAHEFVAGAHSKLGEMTQNAREHHQEQFAIKRELSQQKMRDYFGGKETNASGVKKKAYGYLRNRANGYNIDAIVAARKASEAKKIADQTGNGRDNILRAWFTDEELVKIAGKYGKMDLSTEKGRQTFAKMQSEFLAAGLGDGVKDQTNWKVGDDGTVQIANIAGEFYTAYEASQAHEIYDNNMHALQSGYAYLQRKAADDPLKQERLYRTFGHVAKSMGFDDGQILETTIASGFENAGMMLDSKYRRYNAKTGKVELDALGLARETAAVKDPYTILRNNPSITMGLEDAYNQAEAVINGPAPGPTATPAQVAAFDQQLAAAREVKQYVSGIVYSLKAGNYSLGGEEGDEAAAIAMQQTAQQAVQPQGARGTGRVVGAGSAFSQLQAISNLVRNVEAQQPRETSSDRDMAPNVSLSDVRIKR